MMRCPQVDLRQKNLVPRFKLYLPLQMAPLHGSAGSQVMQRAHAWPGGAMRVPGALANSFAHMTIVRSCLFRLSGTGRHSAAEELLDNHLLQPTRRGVRRRLFACGHANAFRAQCASRTGRGRLICVAAVTVA